MNTHANAQELMMHFDTMEFPRVAHIVADLDALDDELPPIEMPRDSRAREVYRERPSLRHTIFARVFAAASILLLTACASAGSTYKSGVGDALLETPVVVMQFTGALVDSTGRAIRIGAEGIAARRTRLLVSAIGGQELFRDGEVKRTRTARRDDLAGSPLA